jgi:hypothetical protein
MDMMRPLAVNVARELAVAPQLTITGNAGSSVNLTWTDGTPTNYADPVSWGDFRSEIGYRIERAVLDPNGQPGAYTVIETALANTTTYTDLTSNPANSYNYRVVAFNAAGDSPSNIVQVLGAAPAAPTNLAATAASTTRVNLTWTDNSNNETSFTIQRCTGVGCSNFTTIGGVGANLTAYSDLTVAANTTYSYRVAAFNGAGSSQFSNVSTVTTPNVAGPAAPSNLTAALLSNPTRIRLTWRDNSNNENLFQVWRSTNGGAFTQIATVIRTTSQRLGTGGTVSYSNTTGLAAGNTYAYYVIAVNTVPNPDQVSGASNTASVALMGPPAAPSNFSAQAINVGTTDNVIFNWTDNSNNEASFSIQCATNTAFTGSTFINNIAANSTTFTRTGAPRGVTFYCRIRAVNAAGNSAWSNVVSATTP